MRSGPFLTRRRHLGATSSVRYSGISQPSSVATRARPSTETMPQEIERKFLLAHDGWKSSVVKSARIRDGLVAIFNGRKARVRVIEDHATIALKGAHEGLGRSEFEYTIPISDAEEMLRTMCDDRVLEKVRNYVPYAGLTWEIDVYDGILKGVVIAEVEL
jgi:adenylate cyclase